MIRSQTLQHQVISLNYRSDILSFDQHHTVKTLYGNNKLQSDA